MRVSVLIIALLVLSGLGATSSVHAQEAESGSDLQFWVHHTNSNGCCDNWFNALQEDPDHNLDGVSNILTPTHDALPSNPGSPVWRDLRGSNIDYPMQPSLEAPISLDPEGSVLFDVYVGGEEAGVLVGFPGAPIAGDGTLQVSLLQGATTIAETDPTDVTFVAEMVHIEMEAPVQVAEIDPADGNLLLRFRWTGIAPVLVIGGGPSTGHTNFILPEPPAAPDVTRTFTDLDEPELVLSLENQTTGVFTYNWTQNLTDVDVFVEGSARNGTADVTVTDGANATVFEGSLSDFLAAGNGTDNGTANETGPAFSITDAAPGNWTIVITTDSFAGQIAMSFEEPPEEGGQGTSTGTSSGTSSQTGGTTGSSTTAGNGTGNGTVDDNSDKESPGFGMALVGTAALAVALAHRRR